MSIGRWMLVVLVVLSPGLAGRAAEEGPLGPPIIRVQPQDVSCAEGGVAEFAMELAGPADAQMTFQWRRDDKPIKGATSAVYRRSNVASADAGAKFRVEIVNKQGRALSEPATLKIRPFEGLQVAHAPQPPAMDGKDEKIWDLAAPAHAKNLVLGDLATQGLFSARVRALWDEKNLYVRYDVQDARKAEVLKGEPYLNDSVELYLDADNSKSAEYDANDFLFILVRGSEEGAEVKHQKMEGVAVVTAEQERGYRMDVKIPWALLGVRPEAGMFIGLDAHINHGDGKRRFGKLAWFGKADDVWRIPAKMGTGKLGE